MRNAETGKRHPENMGCLYVVALLCAIALPGALASLIATSGISLTPAIVIASSAAVWVLWFAVFLLISSWVYTLKIMLRPANAIALLFVVTLISAPFAHSLRSVSLVQAEIPRIQSLLRASVEALMINGPGSGGSAKDRTALAIYFDKGALPQGVEIINATSLSISVIEGKTLILEPSMKSGKADMDWKCSGGTLKRIHKSIVCSALRRGRRSDTSDGNSL